MLTVFSNIVSLTVASIIIIAYINMNLDLDDIGNIENMVYTEINQSYKGGMFLNIPTLNFLQKIKKDVMLMMLQHLKEKKEVIRLIQSLSTSTNGKLVNFSHIILLACVMKTNECKIRRKQVCLKSLIKQVALFANLSNNERALYRKLIMMAKINFQLFQQLLKYDNIKVGQLTSSKAIQSYGMREKKKIQMKMNQFHIYKQPLNKNQLKAVDKLFDEIDKQYFTMELSNQQQEYNLDDQILQMIEKIKVIPKQQEEIPSEQIKYQLNQKEINEKDKTLPKESNIQFTQVVNDSHKTLPKHEQTYCQPQIINNISPIDKLREVLLLFENSQMFKDPNSAMEHHVKLYSLKDEKQQQQGNKVSLYNILKDAKITAFSNEVKEEEQVKKKTSILKKIFTRQNKRLTIDRLRKQRKEKEEEIRRCIDDHRRISDEIHTLKSQNANEDSFIQFDDNELSSGDESVKTQK